METTKTTKTWKKIVIALLAAILLVMTPMAVAANVNNAGNLKTVAGISAEAKQKNEFYNPNVSMKGSSVQIVPYHVWYQDNKMYADCYVANNTNFYVWNISVDRLEIGNSKGQVIADAGFGTINGSLSPKSYGKHRFIFRKGTFKKADLTKGIRYAASTRFDY